MVHNRRKRYQTVDREDPEEVRRHGGLSGCSTSRSGVHTVRGLKAGGGPLKMSQVLCNVRTSDDDNGALSVLLDSLGLLVRTL